MAKKKTNTTAKTPATAVAAVKKPVKAAKKAEVVPDAVMTTTVTMASDVPVAEKAQETAARRKRGREQSAARNKFLEQDEELAQGIFGSAVGLDMNSDEEEELEEEEEDQNDADANEADDASSEAAADSDDETDSEAGFYEGSEDDEDDDDDDKVKDNDNDELTPPGLDPALNPLRGVIWPEIDAVPDSDSETEQAGLNTVGKIPMEWYKDMPHIGYDLDGKPIMKSGVSDELDKFLANVDDPNTWKTVRDELEQQDVVLSPEDLEVIQRMQQGHFPDANYNPYEPLVEFFSSKTSIMPVTGRDEPKQRFIRSKWEAQRIMQLVRYIRHGVIRRDKHKVVPPRFFDLWTDAPEEATGHQPQHLPAPKLALPGNEESYNPPEEYLPNEKERKTFERTEPSERKQQWLPQKFSALRHVPAYEHFIQERFERCLDLYLAPRARKNRIDVDPESLIPQLPDPKDLEPFPTRTSIIYNGHEGRIRGFSLDASGQWMVSGSDDKTARLWEVATGRCMAVWQLNEIVEHVAWNPSRDISLLSVAAGNKVFLICPKQLWDSERQLNTQNLISTGFAQAAAIDSDEILACRWDKPNNEQASQGILAVLVHQRDVKQIAWHRKGDYFSTIQPEEVDAPVLIHQLAKQQTQRPFRRTKGVIQRVSFHPTKPLFFVATQRYVRIYNLQKQALVKALQSNVKWISSMDIHPQGDNLLIGSYDKRVCWFDLDLSARPYRTLRYHKQAVRGVAYHHRYPLFASCGDDGNLHIFHGMVYNDFLQNPLIVPVQILRGHKVEESLGVLACQFHPTQPWLVSAGADATLRLWC